MIPKAQFAPLGDVSLLAPPSHRGEVNANVRASLKRRHLRLDEEIAAASRNAKDRSVAIVGGGPSVQRFVNELRDFGGDVLVCGTAHDWARMNFLTPAYYMVGDHHPIICDYLLMPDRAAIYFVACQCNLRVFRILTDANCWIVLWHCAWPNQERAFTLEQQAKLSAMQVDGGCTIGLRALSLALMIGYRNVHFYGFDGCLSDTGDEYAYEQGPNPTAGPSDPITEIRLGRDRPGDKVYRCKGWQIAQANDFCQVLQTAVFQPTFHGGGLISDMWDEINADKTRIASARNASIRRALFGSASRFR